MKRIEAAGIVQLLLDDDKIKDKTGRIEFTLGDLSVKVNTKDTVGNLLQEWLKEWFTSKNIEFQENPNRQMFPDFFLNLDDKKTGLLELKTFDWNRGPGFDIANFDSYCNSLQDKAYRLNSDYLILAYQMSDTGNITIKDIWLKKIWEIAGGSSVYPLKVQEKKNIIYNIRPVTWYSERAKYKPFGSIEEFLQAVNNTRYQYNATRPSNSHWLQNVIRNYNEHTGITLNVVNR